MRVLLTNNTLASRAGTELYIRDVSIELLRRGHQPVVYSTRLGEIADEIRNATVPVISRLEALGAPPDIIHAHHNYEAVAALMQFPETPAVSFCHGWIPWEETPLRFPQVRRYVAVSEVIRERLIAEGGISPRQVEFVGNFFDSALFPPRSALPPSARLALSFGNAMGEQTCLPILRKACRRCGLQFEAIGLGVGRAESQPANVLARCDIVFARGRAAIEAMAVGAAVILCDVGRLGPMVTSRNFWEMRSLNFANRALSQRLTEEGLAQVIRQYDAGDAARVSEMTRQECELRLGVDRIVAIYEKAIEDARQQPPVSAAECSRALVRYLEESASHYKELDAELHGLRQDIAAIRTSTTWKLGQRVVQTGILRRLFGGLLQRIASDSSSRAR
jgi:glycosyltransferase involved in cell wall biosynthesis